jgi:hypothetical protein
VDGKLDACMLNECSACLERVRLLIDEVSAENLETLVQPLIHLWETSREGGTEKKPVYFTYKEAMARMKDLRAYKEHSRIKLVRADHFQHE